MANLLNKGIARMPQVVQGYDDWSSFLPPLIRVVLISKCSNCKMAETDRESSLTSTIHCHFPIISPRLVAPRPHITCGCFVKLSPLSV